MCVQGGAGPGRGRRYPPPGPRALELSSSQAQPGRSLHAQVSAALRAQLWALGQLGTKGHAEQLFQLCHYTPYLQSLDFRSQERIPASTLEPARPAPPSGACPPRPCLDGLGYLEPGVPSHSPHLRAFAGAVPTTRCCSGVLPLGPLALTRDFILPVLPGEPAESQRGVAGYLPQGTQRFLAPGGLRWSPISSTRYLRRPQCAGLHVHFLTKVTGHAVRSWFYSRHGLKHEAGVVERAEASGHRDPQLQAQAPSRLAVLIPGKVPLTVILNWGACSFGGKHQRIRALGGAPRRVGLPGQPSPAALPLCDPLRCRLQSGERFS